MMSSFKNFINLWSSGVHRFCISSIYSFWYSFTGELFQLQMGLSSSFLRANDLRTSLLVMRTRSLSYVGLYLNLIANAVNNNDQHVRSDTNVCMSQKCHQRRKRMGTGKLISRRTNFKKDGHGEINCKEKKFDIMARTETSGTTATYGVGCQRRRRRGRRRRRRR